MDSNSWKLNRNKKMHCIFIWIFSATVKGTIFYVNVFELCFFGGLKELFCLYLVEKLVIYYNNLL